MKKNKVKRKLKEGRMATNTVRRTRNEGINNCAVDTKPNNERER